MGPPHIKYNSALEHQVYVHLRPAKQVWLMFIFAAWSFSVSSCSNHPNVIKRRKQVLFRLQQGLRYEEGVWVVSVCIKMKLGTFWAAGELSRWVGEQQMWVMQLKASLGSLPSMPSMPALHRFYQRLWLLSQFADRSKYLNEQQDLLKFSHIPALIGWKPEPWPKINLRFIFELIWPGFRSGSGFNTSKWNRQSIQSSIPSSLNYRIV